jgi:hypothetical protein
MERETDVDPVIDMTAPGSETDQADGSASQLTFEETLDYRGTEDVLDEGYSPPDYPPSVDVPTPAEELLGESLDQRLAEEVPDVSGDDEEERDPLAEVGGVRAGRLADTDLGAGPDTEKDLVAEDLGIDGGAASAEEAAVHIVGTEPGDEDDRDR